MKTKIQIILFVCIAIVAGTPLYAIDEIERDPFAPFLLDIPSGVSEVPVTGEGSGQQQDVYVSPLERNSVYTYKVVGVMTSADKSLAVIKTIERQEFFVRLGDRIGKEGGVVDVINVDGISVVNEEDIVDIPVRNKIEIQPAGRTGAGGSNVQEE